MASEEAELRRMGITPESLNRIEDLMDSGDDRYTKRENQIFSDALNQFPHNNVPEVVAMKIALLDLQNSTNLSRLLGNKKYRRKGRLIRRKVLSFADLVNKISTTPDFDLGVKQGDLSLVSELAEWSKKNGVNLTSFFSKYCLYHNNLIYGGDAYSIYDSVVRKNLGRYVTMDEFKRLFPDQKMRRGQRVKDAVASRINKMKDNCDYESYVRLIDGILECKGITDENVPVNKRRKLDLFVWYLHR